MDYSLPGSAVHKILWARIWSALPFPPPGDLPNPGIQPESHALQVDALLLSHRVQLSIAQKIGSAGATQGLESTLNPLLEAKEGQRQALARLPQKENMKPLS